MDVLDAIEKRWGCRKFSKEDINREKLGSILNAGRLAPSAGNLQDRSFIVVKNSSTKAEIAKACGNQSWMQLAPVHIIIVADNKKNSKFFGEKGEKIYAVQDAAFAVQNMLLAATELGLGASLVIGFNENKLIELLGIEEPAKPYAIVVLGNPAETGKPSSKYPLDKMVFFEKYGSKVENMMSTFGMYEKAKEKITTKAEEGKEEAKKTGSNIIEKIKSIFKKKKEEEPIVDHFLEAKDIPRQLPKF